MTESTTESTIETTTTTEEPVLKVTVTALVGYYLSVDERDFITDLGLASAILDGEDVSDALTFVYDGETYATPAELFKGVGEAYTAVTVDVYYDGAATGETMTIYIAIKGDTDLNGVVNIQDAYAVQVYSAKLASGNSWSFTGNSESKLEVLAYFVSDVDTESLKGQNDNTTGEVINIQDAYNIQVFFADTSAGTNPEWDDQISTLSSLTGSYWEWKAAQ